MISTPKAATTEQDCAHPGHAARRGGQDAQHSSGRITCLQQARSPYRRPNQPQNGTSQIHPLPIETATPPVSAPSPVMTAKIGV